MTLLESLPKDKQGENVLIEVGGKQGVISVGYFEMRYPEFMKMAVPLSQTEYNMLLKASEIHEIEQLNFVRWRNEGVI